MALHRLLPIAGKLNTVIHNVPVVGEMMVRATSRAAGTAAFKLPLIGGKPSNHIGQVRDQLLRFFGLIGLKPRIVESGDGEFEMIMDECPYGFMTSDESDVCDACMDLDRTYIQHLKGRLDILERIPEGAHQCRFKVSFP